MNFENIKGNIKDFLGVSPQKKAQDKYKETAKARGLMSYSQFQSLLQSRDFANLSEIMSDSKIKLAIPCTVNFEITSTTSNILELKDKVIFDNKNFHYIHFANEELVKTVGLLQGKEVDLNVNHSQNPEHFIGSFVNARLNDKDQIVADISIDLDNPSFDSQKYAIKQGGQLGFSIEVEFDWNWDFIIQPINANITGLATTMIPSAPATLTDIDNSELLSGSTDPTENFSVKQRNLSMDTTNITPIVDQEIETKVEDVVTTESESTATEVNPPADEVKTESTPIDEVKNEEVTEKVAEPETLSKPNEALMFQQLEIKMSKNEANFESALESVTKILSNLAASQAKTNQAVLEISKSINKLNEPKNLNNYIS